MEYETFNNKEDAISFAKNTVEDIESVNTHFPIKGRKWKDITLRLLTWTQTPLLFATEIIQSLMRRIEEN
jgi:hypothetical protein